METKQILENLINQFNHDNLLSVMRAKTRTFRQLDENLSYLNDDQFSDCTLFGEFKVNDDMMVVLTAKVNKPLSEKSGKKAQYTLGKKFLKDSGKYIGGFFIFYDDKGDFRFSLIYDIPLATGKRDWSNFRRYTYFVSKQQTNKTFIRQFSEAEFTSLENIIEAFSVEKVTKQFYQEIANWYFWAMDQVEFPDDEEKERGKRNAKNLIRLITRIIFIWFMKEKNLVPSTLFEKSFIDKILNYNDKTGSTYYKAILQNLFFATLNTKMKKDDKESRIFVEEAAKKGYTSDAYLQQGFYRYSRFIKDKNLFIEQFENVPFLNGGLFECLDKKIDGKEIRIDCFSDNPKNETRLKVPDEIFFLENEIEVDLSDYLGKGKSKKVTGLLTILKRYNFTIDENTPIDQDIALDPELLGKVFENLLAAYVPETSETARKATGSYYTPREIVEYMVNESLIEYLNGTGIVPDSANSTGIVLDSENSSEILPDSENHSEDTYPFYNPYKEVDLFYGKKGKLPHMHQGSVWYFVTFRLADSLPKEIVEQLEQERTKWLEKHKNNRDNLTREELKEYYRLFSERVEEWLAAGYGSCILRDERVANILAETLLHFNSVKYDLDDWVIMPNHVHLLVKPKEGYSLSEVMHSIKSFSAHKINELLNKKGDVWLHESYDHIVRNEDAFYAIKKYIRENPLKAKIELPEVCCSWKNKLRSREDSDTFRSWEASDTFRSREASATIRREDLVTLFDYSKDENPFDEQTTLKLIEAIENIKILDPACGSGAFPMGVLHKLVLALHKLDPDNKIWKKKILERVPPEIKEETEKSFENKSVDYIRKLGLIENCIYGVDIQEIAIQISKLRFFISLLVEQNIDDTKPNRDIRALPNLETKFVAANTLIGLNRPSQMALTSGEIETLEKELFKVREEIFYTNSRKEKYELQRKEKQLREKLKTALKQNGFPNDIAEKITSWDPFDQNTHSDWFDPEWMFGIKVTESSGFGKNTSSGFDIVIGNPPYIKEYTNRKAFDGLRDSPYYQGKMDIWYLFACTGIDLLKNNSGLLTFIAQNNWVTSYGASKMRNKIIKETQILNLVDFNNYKIFESADIQTMIMIFKKNSKIDDYCFDYRRIISKDTDFNDILDLLNKKPSSNCEYITPKIKRERYLNKPLTFSSSNIESILNKILHLSNFKLQENEIAQGIVYPQDFVNSTSRKKLGNNFDVGDGIFVLSNEEKNSIPFTQMELNLIKPSYTTRELKKYYGDKNNSEWVIYTDSKFKDPEQIKPYPNIKAHLDKFQKVITSDNKPYGLHRARDEYFFKGEKIIAVRKCGEPIFTYTDFDCYVSATFYVIKSTRINLKYLTALLNSKLIAFWLRHKGKMQGSNYQIDKEPLLALPLKSIPDNKQQTFIELVDKIITAKKQNLDANTSHWEREIDELVYQLYGLTEEEKRIIEGESDK